MTVEYTRIGDRVPQILRIRRRSSRSRVCGYRPRCASARHRVDTPRLGRQRLSRHSGQLQVSDARPCKVAGLRKGRPARQGAKRLKSHGSGDAGLDRWGPGAHRARVSNPIRSSRFAPRAGSADQGRQQHLVIDKVNGHFPQLGVRCGEGATAATHTSGSLFSRGDVSTPKITNSALYRPAESNDARLDSQGWRARRRAPDA